MNNCIFCSIDRGDTQNQPCACGDYKIVDSWNFHFPKYSEENKLKISIFLRQLTVNNFDIRIIGTKPSTPQIFIKWSNRGEKQLLDEKTIDEIIKAPMLPRNERINRALINISKLSEYSGAPVYIYFDKDYPLVFSDNKNKKATKFILDQLLLDGFIKEIVEELPDGTGIPVIITPKGWNKVAEIESTNKDSKKVFVAMWFGDNMLQVFDDHIKPALDGIGYNANHVGITQHNDDINDKIIAEIKTSKFIIADLTGDRGGVYFEAGFAKGLGLPVIFTCREDWFRKELTISINGTNLDSRSVHFDIEHKNIIVWKQDCSDLKEKLIDRIKATID